MGVPGLYWYIKQNYNKVFKSLKILSLSEKTKLYIDGNAFLYPIVNHLSKEGKVIIEEVIKAYVELILGLFHKVKPISIFLAFDGPPPEAKLYQQRQRRFRCIMNANANEFDKNCLSPGTFFLSAVDKGIEAHVAKLNLFTYYHSSTNTPGEGEHKIMEFIKKEKDNFNHYIIGCDGDLIMLGMTTKNQVFLLRPNIQEQINEWLFKKKSFESIFVLLDLTQLRSEINLSLPVWDFIFLCFFLGNDFVPRLRCIHSLKNGIDFFLDVYKTTKNPQIIIKKEIQCSAFKSFLNSINKSEQKLLEDQLDVQQFDEVDKKFFDANLLNINEWNIYKTEYYKDFKVDIKSVCKEYLSILMWCFYYYVYGAISWRGVYTLHYAPLIEDLCEYLQHTDELSNKPSRREPIRPFTQLISILPQRNLEQYLPRDIMVAIEPLFNEIHFPKIEIDFRGKRKDFEGIVKIGLINIDIIELLICQCKSFKYSPENQFKKTKLYPKI